MLHGASRAGVLGILEEAAQGAWPVGRNGAEIFQIHHEGHASYWMERAYPVFLVIGNSEGEVRWMEIRHYLEREWKEIRKVDCVHIECCLK